MPRADSPPLFRTEISEVPSTTNPLGMRGGSEGPLLGGRRCGNAGNRRSTAASPGTPSSRRCLINGYQVSQALHVAATLGVADQLKNGPKFCDAMAQACGAHPTSLYRLLRALAAVGVFHDTAPHARCGGPVSGRKYPAGLADLIGAGVCKGAGSVIGSDRNERQRKTR
jgi:hypothetical protein